jgi:hypothetical protein
LYSTPDSVLFSLHTTVLLQCFLRNRIPVLLVITAAAIVEAVIASNIGHHYPIRIITITKGVLAHWIILQRIVSLGIANTTIVSQESLLVQLILAVIIFKVAVAAQLEGSYFLIIVDKSVPPDKRHFCLAAIPRDLLLPVIHW